MSFTHSKLRKPALPDTGRERTGEACWGGEDRFCVLRGVGPGRVESTHLRGNPIRAISGSAGVTASTSSRGSAGQGRSMSYDLIL